MDQIQEWILTMVETLEDHGGKMKRKDLERITAKILGISPVRMPFVFQSAVREGRIAYSPKTTVVELPVEV